MPNLGNKNTSKLQSNCPHFPGESMRYKNADNGSNKKPSTNLPVLCEEAGVSYCYVASKQALGAAGSTKRPTSVVLCLDTDAENTELRNECVAKIQALPIVGSA